MFTAGSNFTHLVAESKSESHVLVKHGIYAYDFVNSRQFKLHANLNRFLRHPAYTGFFYWAVCLQVLLMNPVCAVAYIITLKRFFQDRIEHEEICLREFFGDEYVEYRAKSFVLIPGID